MTHSRGFSWAAGIGFGLLTTLAVTSANSAEIPSQVQFNRDVRPLLSEHCFKCHGPDETHREADLRLDLREHLYEDQGGGYQAVVPGTPDKSELMRRIVAEDVGERMPPEGEEPLTAEQVEIIRRWIEQGAAWSQHWSFNAPERPDLPTVKRPEWIRNPIDQFVLKRMEAAGLEPSPEADRRTLIRRVTLDLIGLPPTPEEVQAFLNDRSPNAYERVVNRLLRSEHYGEHMARSWLDAARYGDTHGLHLDNYREMWPYRDWVIRAFNQNLPFDQFTVHQLAGDLLNDATEDQIIATGFNRCHVTTNEGGSIAEEVYVRNVVDRVSTTGVVFMGLTLGCAVCHDHKFDPVSQKEFYELFAFFNSMDGPSMDGNVKDHAPSMRVPTQQQRERIASIQRDSEELTAIRDQRHKEAEPAFQAWLNWQQQLVKTGQEPESMAMPDGLKLHMKLDERKGNRAADSVDPKRVATIRDKANWTKGRFGGALRITRTSFVDLGQFGDFDRSDTFSYGAWVKSNGKVTGSAIAKMDTARQYRGYDLHVIKNTVAAHLINRWPGYAIKVTTEGSVLKPNQWHHVFVTYDGSGKAAGVDIYIDGQPQSLITNSDSLGEKHSIKTSAALLLGRRSKDAQWTGGQIDDVRIYDRCLTASDVAAVATNDQITPLLALPAEKRSNQQVNVLRNYYLRRFDAEFRSASVQLDKLAAERRNIDEQAPTTLIFREKKEPRKAFFLNRGQYDQQGEQVQRRTPSVLPAMPEGLPVDRLGLAKWLVAAEHPLTSRVAVNRFWQQTFGAGLVRTSEDFGSQGEPPSHPELLDWLAVQFRESGWDVKRLTKMLVTSATYRQTSNVTGQLVSIDPDNRLLARGPRFRLDAETLRDQALAVSGLLSRQIGGPSVKPPQPDGLWFAVGYSGSNTVKFEKDTGPEKVYRRSLYTFWKRTAPPPQMSTFDAPSRESCVVRRERTNTPLQALLLMNDPQYVEAARTLAQRIMQGKDSSTRRRIAWAFELLTSREPEPMELDELTATFAAHLKDFQEHPQRAEQLIKIGETPPDSSFDGVQLAAWTMIANLLLNLDEVITKG